MDQEPGFITSRVRHRHREAMPVSDAGLIEAVGNLQDTVTQGGKTIGSSNLLAFDDYTRIEC